MSEHTARQHYTPRFRFRYFEDNKLHYEFSKKGKYLGHKGIGRGIATKNNLYEPRDNGYDNILPDCGIICGTNTSSYLSGIIMPITPKICIQRTSIAGGQMRWLKDIRNPVRLRPITERFVKWVNRQSVIQCNEKFISRTRDYTL